MWRDETIAALTRALAHEGAGSSDYDLLGLDPPADPGLRPAGVLIPVDLSGDRPLVILTKRSARLRHHPGQISLPGGRQDPGDADPVAAALREAREEIGLDPAAVRLVGRLPSHDTVTGFRMFPVVGVITAPFAWIAEPGEVDEIFAVPLAHLADPAHYHVEGRRWQGKRRSYFTAPWGPYYIWGATARILRGLALRLAEDRA